MRRQILAVAFALALGAGSSAVPAQSDDYINGEITNIDAAAGKLTIKHGPIKKLGMDTGMTMVFRAGDPKMLDEVKKGDHVRFVPDRVNGQFTVMKIEKAK
jgi:Cu(I)/Ag(I) efflux system protein CusF